MEWVYASLPFPVVFTSVSLGFLWLFYTLTGRAS
jgi:hypothetical protein